MPVSGAAFFFATRAEALATNIGSAISVVTTAAYANPGDRGGGTYRRSVAQPAHPAYFQSLDGAYWEFADSQICPEVLGAVGDGGSDDTSAVWGAMNSPFPVMLHDRVYAVSSTFQNTGSVQIYAPPGHVTKDIADDPVSRLTGPAIKWTGSNFSTIFDLNSEPVAKRVSFIGFCVSVPFDFQGNVHTIGGGKWHEAPLVDSPTPIFENMTYLQSSAGEPGRYNSIVFNISTARGDAPRALFGMQFHSIYVYGFNTIYKLDTGQQGALPKGNWINGNHFGLTHAYKVYRVLDAIGGANDELDGVDQNIFGPWTVQPGGGGPSSPTFADGVVRLRNHCQRNLFFSCQIFDAGGAPNFGRAYKVLDAVNSQNRSLDNMAVVTTFETDQTATQYVEPSGVRVGLLDAKIVQTNRLTFPALFDPSPDPYTLDDYREKLTWTPVVYFGTSQTGTPSLRRALYTKIGAVVTLTAEITLDNLGSGAATDDLYVANLPFASPTPGTVCSLEILNSSGSLFLPQASGLKATEESGMGFPSH